MPHRLLLADDSVTIQRVIELTFAEEGVEVVAVGDGQAAIARLGAERFDVVLADIGMPGGDGFDVAAYVQSRPDLSGLPVVLLTGAFDALDEARVAAVGAAGVLVKPFEPQVAIAKVKELLGGTPPAARPPATPAAAAPPPVAAARSADEYFDRLDRAFASLNPTLEPRDPARPSPMRHRPEPEVEASGGAPMAAPAAPAALPEPPPAPAAASPSSAAPAGLADTFATLLAVEQGELPPSALLPPRTGEDDLVDRIARRVVEQLGDRAVRELAADIVSRTAERLVREEIERIKTEA
jgi:CheY-like chemotaxis protein